MVFVDMMPALEHTRSQILLVLGRERLVPGSFFQENRSLVFTVISLEIGFATSVIVDPTGSGHFVIWELVKNSYWGVLRGVKRRAQCGLDRLGRHSRGRCTPPCKAGLYRRNKNNHLPHQLDLSLCQDARQKTLARKWDNTSCCTTPNSDRRSLIEIRHRNRRT